MIHTWLSATVDALTPLADPARALLMAAYMKDVSDFLGVPTPDRRRALATAWKPLSPLDEQSLAAVCAELWELPEREYQYSACDLIATRSRTLSAAFVPDVAQNLMTTKPWWDTVDSLGSAAVTPLVERHRLVELMWSWLDSGDRWLVRAAIQHQRGLEERTDLDRLLGMCDRVAAEREFFIAKAVGWALRDTTAFAPAEVQSFVDDHPRLSPVARREALRGLARSARP
ncbi:MAG: DNA alkylation repair protein [bacterium]|nr:DNA alkylation repair protein [bacterium]